MSAAIHAAKSRVYLALGSNLGDRKANLHRAAEAMPPAVQPTAFSTIYETPPWGVLDQPAFLNQVICAATALAPLALLDYLKQVELDLGRRPGVRYGPRLIDLDILFYDDLVVDDPRLTIPHPRLAERAFVLVPLNDLAPDLRHPFLGDSMAQLLAQLDARDIKPYRD